MFERFTDEARGVVVSSQGHARRLGHDFIGCEHLLLSLSGVDGGVGQILRSVGATPAAVEAAMGRMIGERRFQGVDRDALAAIGIDLDAVREKIEEQFGPAKMKCSQRRRRRRRRQRCEPGAGHIPFTPRTKKCLELSLREAIALRDRHVGAEHILLGLTRVKDSVGAEILTGLGVSLDGLRAETLNRHRKAG